MASDENSHRNFILVHALKQRNGPFETSTIKVVPSTQERWRDGHDSVPLPHTERLGRAGKARWLVKITGEREK